MVDINTIISDPDFHRLPLEERRKVLKTIDKDFSVLAPQEQDRAISGLSEMFSKQQQAPSRQTSELPPLNLLSAHSPEMAASHAPTSTPKTDFERRWIAPIVRGTLEGGGALGGAVIGSGLGPAGTASGGILGYAGGAQAADIYEEARGLRAKKTMGEALTSGVKDLAVGAAFTAGGELAGRGIMATLSGGKVLFNKIGQGIEKSAAKRIAAYTSDAPIYAKNAEEAIEIENIINANAKPGDPKFQFNLGQRSGDPNQIKLEISAALPKGKGAELKDTKAMENAAALARYREENFGGEEGIEDVLGAIGAKKESIEKTKDVVEQRARSIAEGIETKTPEQTGYEAVSAIKKEMTPVKSKMNELKAQIPDYPIKLTNLETELQLISRDPEISKPQQEALEKFIKYLDEKAPKGETTTRGALGIDRTIDDYAKTAYAAKEDSVGALFTRIKNSGLKNDIKAISDLARTGKLVEYQGKAINTDQLAVQLEDDLLAVADMRQAMTPNIEAIKKGIKDAGGRVPMQVVREQESDYIARLSKDFQNLTKQEVPMKGASSPEAIKKLEDRIAENRQILSEVSPGQDVGAAMSAYKRYAETQYFDRFKRGVMEDVTAKGNEYTKGRIQIEDIPKRFKDPSGADDFIRAVGAPKAKELMRGNIAYDMMEKVTDPVTKEVNTRALEGWLKQNRVLLEKYGLTDEFTGLQNAQALVEQYKAQAKVFEKSIAGKMIGYKVSGEGYPIDPNKAISTVLQGNRTGAQMSELVQMIGNDKTALKGLQNAYGDWITEQAYTTWKGAADNPTVSMAQFVKTMQKAREGARVLYRNEPEKVQALETMQRAYEIMARSSRSPGGVGADTAEKITNIISNQAANALAQGSMTFRAAKKFAEWLTKIGKSKQDELIARGVFDPDYAYNIMNGVRGRIAPDKIDAVMNDKVIMLEEYRLSRIRSAAMLAGDKYQQQGE
jgi:hypothetical protein